MKTNLLPPASAVSQRPIPRQSKSIRQRLARRSSASSVLFLLLLVLPSVVQAQFTYTTNNGAITITGYTGSGGAVMIPSTINGLPVISVGDKAFDSFSSLTQVTIPNSVTNIGFDAFGNCTSLTNITIPNSVTGIGDWAFQGCSGLTSVTIGSSVADIGSYAFSSCISLTEMTIPNSVTNLGLHVFTACFNLTAITVDALNPVYSSVDGVVFDKSQTALIQYPPAKAGTSYTIPDSVTSIEGNAFDDAGLTNVTTPNSVTNIGLQAFSQCPSLTSITVDTLNPVYSSVVGVLFNKSQTTLIQFPEGIAGSYTIPNSATSIGSYAFAYSRLTNVTIGNSITNIGINAFLGSTFLTSVRIPDSITDISMGAFSSCEGLTSISIPNSVTDIGVGAFTGCSSLTSVAIPNSVTSIGFLAFWLCTGLTNVAIGNGVTSIGSSAFDNCSGLTSLTIPASVSIIGSGAFSLCTNLTSVYFLGDAPSLAPDIFCFVSVCDPATVYYLPGTMGWGTTFSGRPTALWLPQIQSSDASFGVHANQFGFDIAWASGRTVVVEATTNLANTVWSPVSSNTLIAGSSYFSDSAWTNYPSRFYRLRPP